MLKYHQREFAGLKHTSIIVPTDRRPVCQRCEKPMKLATRMLYFEPDPERAEKYRWEVLTEETEGALAWTKASKSSGGTVIDVWFGDYLGYGWCNGLPLFCTYRCALKFAEVQYNAGQRITVDGVQPSTRGR